jgi:hypothetical protein
MGFSTAGLSNGGQTAYYQTSYDDTFSDADGRQRALQLMNRCDIDFQIMQGWFSGVNFKFSLPIKAQIANASGGASWNDNNVTINAPPGTTTSFIRYLLVTRQALSFPARLTPVSSRPLTLWFLESPALHQALVPVA